MATQTGSIDLTSTAAVKLFAEAGYQNAIAPNLTPYFAHYKGDTVGANPDSPYWNQTYQTMPAVTTAWDFEQSGPDGLGGWAHLAVNNASGSTAYLPSYVHKDALVLKASTKYTFLVEWSDVAFSGGTPVLYATTEHGGTNGSNDDFFTTTTSVSLTVGSGSKYIQATTRSSLESGCLNRIRTHLWIGNGITVSGYLRISLYEGEYDGPYKPYVGYELYATRSELKVAADGITSTVEKISSAKYLTSAYLSSGWNLSDIRNYGTDGTITTFKVVSTEDAKVGDTVYIKGKDKTRNCIVYLKGVVEEVPSTTSIKISGRGYEDVLPVDTIKSTINQSSDSVKIQAKHIEIDGTAMFRNSDNTTTTLGSYVSGVADSAADSIQIGGRNLLRHTTHPEPKGLHSQAIYDTDGWYVWSNPSVAERTNDGIKATFNTNGNGFVIPFVNDDIVLSETDYILSFDARGTFTGPTTVYALARSGSNWQTNEAPLLSLSETEWTHVEIPVKWPSFGGRKARAILYPYANTNGKWIEIRDGSTKFEKGNRATDWTPAPEDQTAYVDESIDGISIGGRNLYKSTTVVSKVGSGAATISAYDASYHGRTFTVTSGGAVLRIQHIIPETNVPYTISFTCTASVACHVQVDIMDNVVQHFDLPAGTSKFVCTSTPYRAIDSTYHFIDIQFNAAGTYKLADIMVEQATKPSAWSPAPEDVDASIESVANDAAPKSSAVARTQRIYWRATSNTKPSANTTWLSTSGDGYGNWSLNVPQLTKGSTKYPYLYTAVQSQTVAQQAAGTTCSCSAVVIDDSTTVIDGGSIITHSVTAEEIDATDLHVSSANIDGSLTIGQLDSSTQTKVNNGDSAYSRHTAYRGTCSTAAGTAAKAVMCTGFALDTGATVEVYCSTANTADVPTLNVNSKGAKAIWINGAAASASNPCKWQAGDTVTFTYDGARFRASLPVENYVTATTDGIKIHMAGNSTTYQHQTANATTFYVGGKKRSQVGATGMQVFVGDTAGQEVSVASFGSTTRIGKASEAHVVVKPTYLMETTPSGTNLFEVGRILDDDGYADYVDVEKPSEDTSVFALTYRGETIKGYTYDDQTTEVTINPLTVSVDGVVTSAYTLSAVAQAGGDVVHVTLNTAVAAGSVVQIAYRTTAAAVLSMQFGHNAQATGECSSAFGVGSIASGTGALAEGGYYTVNGDFTDYYNGGTAKGDASHAEGVETIASGMYSHAEGYRTMASRPGSHAEGDRSTASGSMSHAEGFGTKASDVNAHAEGNITTASNSCAHAEGCRTTASGEDSHAEGYGTTASNWTAHAQNFYTKAGYSHQTTIGKYNSNQSGNAFEIGNGTADSARSNALTVDWNGNLIAQGMAGMVQMFAGSTAPTGWLICNGSAVSRTTYATLFAVIGTTWGAGDGSTTFNLPDLRGRAPIGAGTGSGLTARSLAAKGGSQNIQAHTHAFTQPTVKTELLFQKNAASGSAVNRVAGSNLSDPAATSTYTATVTGGAVGAVSGASTGTAGNMPPFTVINFIICAGKTS